MDEMHLREDLAYDKHTGKATPNQLIHLEVLRYAGRRYRKLWSIESLKLGKVVNPHYLPRKQYSASWLQNNFYIDQNHLQHTSEHQLERNFISYNIIILLDCFF